MIELNSIKKDMDKAIENVELEFTKIRTGRANPAMLDSVKVEAYGTLTPLNQVAIISVPEARQLAIKPFDPSQIKIIEEGIVKLNLGLTPNSDGEIIRLNIPALTEESRKILTKEAKDKAENGKIKIRNIRQNANTQIKKEKDLSDDEKKSLETDIQNIVNEYNKKIDNKLELKNKDIMTI